MEFYQKRETRLVNLYAWIALISSVIGVSTVFFIRASYPTTIALFSILTSLAVIIFNYKELYNFAIYTFVFSTNFSIFIIVQQYEVNVGNYLYYFPIIFCIALIHNPTKSNFRTIGLFAMVVVSFLCSWFFEIDSLKNTTVSQRDSEILLTYNSILTLIMTIIIVYYVVKLINNQNNETIEMARKEHEAQIIISQSLKEKETLLAEIQHRVKNNLAIITGLLNLQTEKAPCDESRLLMIESRNRVMSISMVHERLYKKDNLSKINLKIYLSELIQELVKNYPINDQLIAVEEDLQKIEIEVTKAVPIGLIINEALTNSLKHAFKTSEKQPTIHIKMHQIFDKIQISLKDNGVGFNDTTKRKDTSLGLSLIESLSDQIDAEVSFKNEPGACVSILFNV